MGRNLGNRITLVEIGEKKAGRPYSMGEPTIQVNVRLLPEKALELDRISVNNKAQYPTLSAAIYDAMRDFMENPPDDQEVAVWKETDNGSACETFSRRIPAEFVKRFDLKIIGSGLSNRAEAVRFAVDRMFFS